MEHNTLLVTQTMREFSKILEEFEKKLVGNEIVAMNYFSHLM